ncbi:hypothetical protein [Streptomyces sp.]|uniref:hypothetical protein n=1 Tax=Streptomyces sp. TaxID=1931 RepID=UPI002C47B3EB|nr:hypothetical protein [Streptomyces sp.]HLL36726.1 hypothetical protein [Streptomyces sp.]HZF87431.1 hypothetical protein [Streptomyces sp.]
MRTGGQRGPEIWIRGPVASEPPRRFSWVGAHGGSGVSTLAAVYGGQDCGRDWPGPADPPAVLLVGRTHAAGLDAVARALADFRDGEVPRGLGLAGAVLVADAPGRLPRPLARRIGEVEAAVGVYRVPWVSDWRLGDLGGGPPRGTEALARLTGAGR